MEVFSEFGFEAAHHLPQVPEGHPCRRLHGHSYRVRVVVCGRPAPATGFVVDFAVIAAAAAAVREQLDHRCLNDVAGLANPTVENLARWLWQQMRPSLPQLSRLEIHETATAGCIYAGELE